MLFLGVALHWGCRRTIEFPGSNIELAFSQDTVYLDTVFTGLGSSTRTLKVFNSTNENMTIDRVFLGRGQGSYYRLNVDGISGKDVQGVEILAGDSAYVFIEISPDAAGATELVYTDSIVFENGAVKQHVALVTAVWDAYYHFPTNVLTINRAEPLPPLKLAYSVLPDNELWDDSKPHVIYGYAVVDSARTLTIEPGAQVHFHNGSGLWVYRDGTLLVDPNKSGSMDNPVVFQGDRLEPSYEWIPGQWGGLLGGVFIMGGAQTRAEINNTIIKNSTTAIRVDSAWSSTPNLNLENVILTHNSRVSLYGGFGRIQAANLAIGPSGVYGFYGLGGNYRFDHSTFHNTWGFSSRGGTSIGMVNFFEDAVGDRFTREINALFTNCFIGGSLPSEVSMGIDDSEIFGVVYRNSAMVIDPNPEAGHYTLTDTTMFQDSEFNLNWGFSASSFIPEDQWKFIPDSVSILFGKSVPTGLTPPRDLLGDVRATPATLGAVERK